MINTPIKLVCFDLGGVVVRICRSWSEGCRNAGIDVRHDEQTLRAWQPRWRELVRAHQTGQITCGEYFTAISTLTGSLYRPAEIETVHQAWILGEYAGIGDLVKALHERTIETAALSNTNASHWTQLVECDAVKQFRHCLTSHELELYKPDPAIFHTAERHLNARSNEILFFDDTEENVVTAHDVGWRAEHIDPSIETAPQIREALARHGLALDNTPSWQAETIE